MHHTQITSEQKKLYYTLYKEARSQHAFSKYKYLRDKQTIAFIAVGGNSAGRIGLGIGVVVVVGIGIGIGISIGISISIGIRVHMPLLDHSQHVHMAPNTGVLCYTYTAIHAAE